MRVHSTDPKVRENRLRFQALRQEFVLTKARGENVWFLWDRRAKQASVHFSLDEVEQTLEADEEAFWHAPIVVQRSAYGT